MTAGKLASIHWMWPPKLETYKFSVSWKKSEGSFVMDDLFLDIAKRRNQFMFYSQAVLKILLFMWWSFFLKQCG